MQYWRYGKSNPNGGSGVIERGEVTIGPGGLVRAEASTDCVLSDYKVVITSDKRVFVRGELRGELQEMKPSTPAFHKIDSNPALRVCRHEVRVVWMRVVQ